MRVNPVPYHHHRIIFVLDIRKLIIFKNLKQLTNSKLENLIDLDR